MGNQARLQAGAGIVADSKPAFEWQEVLHKLAGFFNTVFEKTIIDGLVNGVGRLVNYGSRQMRLLQSGQVGNYVLLMVVSMVLIFVLQFFLRK
ncbi:MAG: chorismate-binding protein, partial [Chitinophagaceae bacterium]